MEKASNKSLLKFMNFALMNLLVFSNSYQYLYGQYQVKDSAPTPIPMELRLDPFAVLDNEMSKRFSSGETEIVLEYEGYAPTFASEGDENSYSISTHITGIRDKKAMRILSSDFLRDEEVTLLIRVRKTSDETNPFDYFLSEQSLKEATSYIHMYPNPTEIYYKNLDIEVEKNINVKLTPDENHYWFLRVTFYYSLSARLNFKTKSDHELGLSVTKIKTLRFRLKDSRGKRIGYIKTEELGYLDPALNPECANWSGARINDNK
jgi:hypothetical protein